jgi:hypothetical protein
MLVADTADRALVRRFNFLGFPGEKKGEALTYAGLRAELGDDHASALVVQAGVIAKLHHLDQLGIGIDHAVARMIQSMTADERRSVAKGGPLPPRVEAMITADAEAAKLQQKQTGAGPNSGTRDPSLSPNHPAGLGAFGFGASRGLSGRGGDAGGGDRQGYQSISYGTSQSLQGITAHNFEATPFATNLKMDFGTFNYVRSYDRNFNGGDIRDAVKQTGTLGFTPHDKEAIAHQALIEHYDPKKEETHQLEQAYISGLRGSPEFRQAAQELANAKPEQRAAAEARFKAVVKRLQDESGIDAAAHDPARPAPAQKGITIMKDKDIPAKVYEEIVGRKLELQSGIGDEPARQLDTDRLKASSEASVAKTSQTADARPESDIDSFFNTASAATESQRSAAKVPNTSGEPASALSNSDSSSSERPKRERTGALSEKPATGAPSHSHESTAEKSPKSGEGGKTSSSAPASQRPLKDASAPQAKQTSAPTLAC